MPELASVNRQTGVFEPSAAAGVIVNVPDEDGDDPAVIMILPLEEFEPAERAQLGLEPEPVEAQDDGTVPSMMTPPST